MLHSVQMKESMDEEFYHRKLSKFRKIDEDFPRTFRNREGEDIGRVIFAAVTVVQLLRKRVPAEDE